MYLHIGVVKYTGTNTYCTFAFEVSNKMMAQFGSSQVGRLKQTESLSFILFLGILQKFQCELLG